MQLLEDYIQRTMFLKTARKIGRLDQDAVEMASREKPGLLFLDLNTNGLNKELIRMLTGHKTSTALILATTYPMAYIRDLLETDLSRIGYLPKPSTYDAFLKEVKRILAYHDKSNYPQ